MKMDHKLILSEDMFELIFKREQIACRSLLNGCAGMFHEI